MRCLKTLLMDDARARFAFLELKRQGVMHAQQMLDCEVEWVRCATQTLLDAALVQSLMNQADRSFARPLLSPSTLDFEFIQRFMEEAAWERTPGWVDERLSDVEESDVDESDFEFEPVPKRRRICVNVSNSRLGRARQFDAKLPLELGNERVVRDACSSLVLGNGGDRDRHLLCKLLL